MTKSFPFKVVMVVAALALAACGGGDDAPANAASSAIAPGSQPAGGTGGPDPGAPAAESMSNSTDM